MNYELWIMNYELWIMNYEFRMKRYGVLGDTTYFSFSKKGKVNCRIDN